MKIWNYNQFGTNVFWTQLQEFDLHQVLKLFVFKSKFDFEKVMILIWKKKDGNELKR